MFSHVTLGTNDWVRARPFWMAVMEVLGHPVLFEREGGVAYGDPAGPKTFVGPTFDGARASVGNGSHIAYIVPDRATVDRFHAVALRSHILVIHHVFAVPRPRWIAEFAARPFCSGDKLNAWIGAPLGHVGNAVSVDPLR